MKRPLHVGVDARPLSRETGGIKRYLFCLLEQMVKNQEFFFTLYSDGPLPKKYVVDRQNVEQRIISTSSVLSKISWSFKLSEWLKHDRPDIFWSPRHHVPWIVPQTMPIVVTIHDVIWKSHPQTLEPGRLLNEKLSMPNAIKKSSKILTPSKATADEICKYWPASKAKINIIKHGETKFEKYTERKSSIEQEYYLAVGTIEPRKNYVRLLKAFDRWSENHQIDLVIAGQLGWGYKAFYKQLDRSKHKHRIHIITDADDTKLVNLYTNAKAFIQLSLAEGFGMPIAEARQFGLPVLLADIPVFQEITRSQVAWANPHDADSILQGFDKLLELSSFKSFKEENLLEPWQKVSQRVLTLFQSLII